MLSFFPLHEANHLLPVDQWHEKTLGDGPSKIHHAYHVVLHQPIGSADSAPTLAWAMSALPEFAQLSVGVVVVDVGEHLHDLGLFLFQTSDIQHNYSKFRDFLIIDTYRDIEYILEFSRRVPTSVVW